MKKLLLGLAASVAVLALPAMAGAQVPDVPTFPTTEEILSFHSDIEVFTDSHLEVKETIKVQSAGQEIQHGIYRDFPTVYTDSRGVRHIVGFDVLSVQRDGAKESYHIQRGGNGLRLYLGDANYLLPAGQHTYIISYKTNGQLGYFPDHDELYWNVTGNGWVFPIDVASATVKLSGAISKDKINTTFYTGTMGSTAQAGTGAATDNGATFQTSQALAPYEGLTIVVGWPKGFVTPPTAAQNFWNSVSANRDYVIGLIGFLVTLGYYLYMWFKVGRDPRKGTVIAQYESPQDLSPAMLRFIKLMRSDNRAFAAALLNLAVKGSINITESKGFFGKVNYTVSRKADTTKQPLSKEEEVLHDNLFSGSDTIELKRSNAIAILQTVKAFQQSLTDQAGKKYFVKNAVASFMGFVLFVITEAATIYGYNSVNGSIGPGVHLVFIIGLVVAFLIMVTAFASLLRAYTPEGRKLMDEIEGFKLFLSVTEKDRLNFHNPPERTPELFEKMLPFALALGVEHQWAQQFAEVFARLSQQGTNYVPAWYAGYSLATFHPDTFASTIGKSFTGVVSAAASPPGSGSGFGGGSSGGGGGGGGGGGW